MSHYEQRLAEDLKSIREAMQAAADAVDSGLKRSIEGLKTSDYDLLHEVVLDDLAINRQIREIDALCHAFVARHLPAAGHLRFVSSVLRLTIGLERAGDYAVTICRAILQLETKLDAEMVEKIAEMSELARSMLAQAAKAFLDGDEDLANETRTHGIRIDRLYDGIFHALINEDPRRPPMELASLLTIFGRIERVSDQAKNICEETVFSVTGETIAPKVFRILFLDADNALVSQLAQAVAWKSFPKRGVYSSAGWSPAAEVDKRLFEVADRFSLDVGNAKPVKVNEQFPDYPIEYHVVVGLNCGSGEHIPHIPYHTVLQRWNDLPQITATEKAELDEQLDQLVRELNQRIRSLMERLRGDVADDE